MIGPGLEPPDNVKIKMVKKKKDDKWAETKQHQRPKQPQTMGEDARYDPTPGGMEWGTPKGTKYYKSLTPGQGPELEPKMKVLPIKAIKPEDVKARLKQKIKEDFDLDHIEPGQAHHSKHQYPIDNEIDSAWASNIDGILTGAYEGGEITMKDVEELERQVDEYSFEDAIEAAVEIYKVMQEIEEQKEQEKIGESNDENQEGGQGQVEDGESMDFEETPDQEIINPNQPWDKGEQVQQEGQVPSGTRSGGVDYDPFQSQTDDAFTQGTKDLTEEPRYGRENVYVELPKNLNPDHFIVGADYLLKVNQNHFSEENDLKEEGKKESYDRTVEEYNNFYKKSQKEVNYLVKEFECKKAATSYARARTSRTGVLDTTKLHTYKFTDDIFKKVTVLPEGKNHGMIFLLDWSGSMSSNIRETTEQVIQLSWFCKKVNIPFDVYAFTNDGFASSYRMDVNGIQPDDDYPHREKTLHEPVIGEFALENGFTLLNVVSSTQKKKQFEASLMYLYINATANNFRSYYSFKNGFAVSFTAAPGFNLSGTPLNEALVLMRPIIKAFSKRVDKLTLCVLTDGEGQCSSYYSELHQYNNRPYANSLGYNCFLRDRKLGRTYEKFDGSDQVTEVLLQNLRETYPMLNVIGFRLLGSRDGHYFFSRAFEYDTVPMEKAQKAYRKDKYVALTNTGYNKLFVMPSNNQNDTEELWDDIKEDSTRAEITRTFKKMFKNKKSNKKMHNSFIETVA